MTGTPAPRGSRAPGEANGPARDTAPGPARTDAAEARTEAPEPLRLLPGMDAQHIASQALDLLCEDHDYRRVPRSPRIPDQSGQGDYASGAAAAREALARARAKVEGEQHS